MASEFILVAATLMRIKAKMLIPRKEIDEEGNEIDPRQELAQKLLEYRKYKAVLDEMSALEESRHFRHTRGNVSDELKQIAEKALVDVELESLSLFKLLQTFQQLLQRYNAVSYTHLRYIGPLEFFLQHRVFRQDLKRRLLLFPETQVPVYH